MVQTFIILPHMVQNVMNCNRCDSNDVETVHYESGLVQDRECQNCGNTF